MTPVRTGQKWSERHINAVRAAAPSVPPFSSHQQDELWHQIASAAVPKAPRVRRWKAAVAGVVAACALGVAGAAAANVFSAHTGKFATDAEDLELAGPGERLNPQGSDFAVVLDEATRDINFPSAQSRDRALAWEVEDWSDEPDALVSTGALRLWTAGHALCSWSDVWARALRTGDTEAKARAAGVILAARAWPSIADIDTDLAHQSEAAWLPDLQRAVRAEDTAAATTALGSNGACMPGLAPELGLGRRW